MMHYVMLNNHSTHSRTVVHFHEKSLTKQVVNKLTIAIVCDRMAALLAMLQNTEVHVCVYGVYVKARFTTQPVLKRGGLL